MTVAESFAPFALTRVPKIAFGAGARSRLPALAADFGTRVLLVTGATSLRRSSLWPEIEAGLRTVGLDRLDFVVAGEPSPDLVDGAVATFARERIDVVIGIGGGSVLDGAKAIAGLLRTGTPVAEHLEGVGPELPYRGPAVPFIAVPTTAGTGSEATRNAVLSVRGAGGYKKSFRDEKLVAEWAVVDPDFLASVPRPLIAADGMDALTQLLESYVSTRANPITDALALSGLDAVRRGLSTWHEGRDRDGTARAAMAYAALLSGITLAQAGLGAVHGLASPLGAFFPAPHGAVCGTLLAATTRTNLAALGERDPNGTALRKYAEAGRVLTGTTTATDGDALAALVDLLERMTDQMALPRLAAFGIVAADVPRIVAGSRGSSMKTNPVVLTDAEVAGIVTERL
ncbi:MAG: iron-containing alcohol dehydrogenase [Bauldia sp.]|nr:iron-containing alcohol dehydrogenase [Bauldia sp.]